MGNAPQLDQIKLGLDRILEVLPELGNPHTKLPPIIHIAGTNGKGSTAAYLTAIFQEAGYKVHRYTSPHLVRPHERIMLANREISDAELQNALREVKQCSSPIRGEVRRGADLLKSFDCAVDAPAPTLPLMGREKIELTPFEEEAAAMFLAMSKVEADVAIIEVGLGGRGDATNVVAPALTIITPVSMDHMNFLGNTIEKIAGEKAGIIKSNVPCVVGKQTPEAMAVIEKIAAGKNAEVIPFSVPDLSITPSLHGAYQKDNAAVAATAALQLQKQFPKLTPEIIEEGVRHAQWKGRLQELQGTRFNEKVPGANLWLDGGHNAQGGEVLGHFLSKYNRPIYLICGMMSDKDTVGYLTQLKQKAKFLTHVVGVEVPDNTRSHRAQDIETITQSVGIRASHAPSVDEALDFVGKQMVVAGEEEAYVVICGSLFLVGHVLSAIPTKADKLSLSVANESQPSRG